MARNCRIEDHQKCCDGHSDDRKQRKQATLISEIKINICRAYAADDKPVAYLLKQEDKAYPKQLIVAGDGRPDLFEAYRGRVGVFTVFTHTENCEAQKQRSDYADYKRNFAVGNGGAAADGHVADREHGYENARKRSAYAGKQRCARCKLISRVCVGRECRNHSPIGYIVHRVGYRIHEVDHSEEPHKAPALKIGVERKIHDDRGREYADDEPGLEFAPARARALDDVAHDRVV